MSNLLEFLDEEPQFDLEETVKTMVDNHENYTNLKYSIYIPSKGRAHHGETANLLDANGIDYKIVVEPQDYDKYVDRWGKNKIIMMPENDKGISYARSFIKQYSHDQGEARHWQMDDDMKSFRIRFNNKNNKVNPKHCFSIIETVADMFTNVGICGVTSMVYAFAKDKQVSVNKMAYGVVLVDSNIKEVWRPDTNEDLDFSLQLLEAKYIVFAFNTILFETFSTGSNEGGNQMNLFAEDGRRRIYENTAALWPGRFVVKQLSTNRGWTLKHSRKFYADYKHKPILIDKSI